MNTNRFKILFVAVCMIIAPLLISGQDIHYSMYPLAPLNINAGYTGLMNQDYRLSLHSRSQWKSVSTPYKTYSAAFDMRALQFNDYKQQISFGLGINNDVAGDGGLNSLSGNFNIAVSTFVGSDSSNQFSLGVQLGFLSRSINFNKLYFDDQFNGDVFDPNLSQNETYANDQKTMFDATSGISFRHFTEAFEFVAGAGLQHINKPEISFYNDKSVKLPMNFICNAYASFSVTENVKLLPSVLYMKQNTLSEFTFGTSVGYKLADQRELVNGIDAGIFLRTGDAIFLSAGVDLYTMHLGFSYDINTSGLKRASNSKGAYEFALVYTISKVKSLKPSVPCIVF